MDCLIFTKWVEYVGKYSTNIQQYYKCVQIHTFEASIGMGHGFAGFFSYDSYRSLKSTKPLGPEIYPMKMCGWHTHTHCKVHTSKISTNLYGMVYIIVFCSLWVDVGVCQIDGWKWYQILY